MFIIAMIKRLVLIKKKVENERKNKCTRLVTNKLINLLVHW